MLFKMANRARKPQVSNLIELIPEVLEDRTLLSTVQILAEGNTGDENMSLVIDDQVVASWESISPVEATYTYETIESIDPRDIRIEFTNDEYRPEEGYDRNLFLYSVDLDGETLSPFAPDTFASGVYIPGEGLTSGFLQSNELRGNGFFQFKQKLDYGGFLWEVDGDLDAVSVNESGQLNIQNGASQIAISRQLDNFDSQVTYSLDYDIERNSEVGQQWAVVGINFYDFNGDLIPFGTQRTELQFEVNELTNSQQFTFTPPDGATTAFLWLWINGSGSQAEPVVVNELEVNVANDVNAPELSEPLTVTSFPRFNDDVLEFRAVFRDVNLTRDGVSTDAFTLVRSDGRELNPFSVEVFDRGLDLTVAEVKIAPEGGWVPEDSGTWFVRINADSVVDNSGNAFPESFVELDVVSVASNREALPSLNIQIYDPVTDDQGPREEFLDAFVGNTIPAAVAYIRFIDPNGVNVGWIDAADFFLVDPDGNVLTNVSTQFSSVGEGTGDDRFVTTTIFWDLDSVRETEDRRPWQIGVNRGGVADNVGQTNLGGIIASFDPG